MSLHKSELSTDIILKAEHKAQLKIRGYILKEFEERQKDPGKCSDFDEEFWTSVVQSFNEYFDGIDSYYIQMLYDPAQNQDEYDMDSFKKQRQFWKKNLSEKRKAECKEKRAHWIDPIDELKEAFENVEKTYLHYSRYRKYCQQMFSELLKKIQEASQKTTENAPKVLGSTHFKHIGEMLNCQDEDIVRLLPFLLTAYVYNFRKNIFMERKSTENDETALIYDADKTNVSRIRKYLDKLDTYFGFAGNEIKFSNTDKILAKLNGGPSVFHPTKFPSLQDKPILDLVFAAWCVILSGVEDSCGQAISTGISKNIDIGLSYKLYTYYTDESQYNLLESNGFPTNSEMFQMLIDEYNSFSFVEQNFTAPEK